ncbi:MAG: regulatory protein RecX [Acidobacteriota bacterium]
MAGGGGRQQGAEGAALRLLAQREHSRGELRRKLLARGYAEEETERALDRLEARGDLDEGRFVEALTRSELERGRGLLSVRAKLGRAGLPERAPAAGREEERRALLRLLESRGLSPRTLTDGKERARIWRFLRGRGFTPALLREVFGPGDTEDGP